MFLLHNLQNISSVMLHTFEQLLRGQLENLNKATLVSLHTNRA